MCLYLCLWICDLCCNKLNNQHHIHQQVEDGKGKVRLLQKARFVKPQTGNMERLWIEKAIIYANSETKLYGEQIIKATTRI